MKSIDIRRQKKNDRIFEIIGWTPTLFRKLVKFWNFESLLFSIKNEPYAGILSRLHTAWAEIFKQIIDGLLMEIFLYYQSNIRRFSANLHEKWMWNFFFFRPRLQVLILLLNDMSIFFTKFIKIMSI